MLCFLVGKEKIILLKKKNIPPPLVFNGLPLRPKKKYCLFPISDRPYRNMCDPNLFYGFPPKKEIRKLRNELLAVVKVTKKTLRKGDEGSKNIKKQKIIT